MPSMPNRSLRRPAAALVLSVAALLASGCATSPAAPPLTRPPVAGSADFDTWKRDFAAEARTAGISEVTVSTVVPRLRQLPELLPLDRQQPEFVKPIWSYIDATVSNARIERGRRLRAEHAATLDAIAARSGVPAEIVVAIWGKETDFGGYTGRTPVYDALATLASTGRRQAFYRSELLAALTLVDRGMLPASPQPTGSWAGAMGQTQFMPGTWLRHAVDGDGDGRIDLYGSLADAFASTAAYLAASGWPAGQPWGWEVRLPAGFDWALAGEDRAQPLAAWAAAGVTRADGRPLAGGLNATLLVPTGRQGPVFLLTDGFRAIMKYNASTSYALAVALLGDQLAGRPGLAADWPRSQPLLSVAETRELQERLAARGYDSGTPDGMLGTRTRTAVRGYQQRAGMVPDGWPTAELLARLRAEG